MPLQGAAEAKILSKSIALQMLLGRTEWLQTYDLQFPVLCFIIYVW
jgi:hypothetical protein